MTLVVTLGTLGSCTDAAIRGVVCTGGPGNARGSIDQYSRAAVLLFIRSHSRELWLRCKSQVLCPSKTNWLQIHATIFCVRTDPPYACMSGVCLVCTTDLFQLSMRCCRGE